MALIQQLKVTSAKPNRDRSPVVRFRRRMVEAVDLQIAIAIADLAGESFTRLRQRWVKTETGKELRNVPQTVRRWWWSDDKGVLHVILKYGAKTIELAPGKSAIEVGDVRELPAKLKIVRDAILAGELDNQAKSERSIPKLDKQGQSAKPQAH